MKLTAEQERVIRQEHAHKSVKQLAKELGLSRRQVEEAVAAQVAAPWEGRESRLLLLAGAVLVLVLGFAGYTTNLTHDQFHFDDQHAVEQNDAIKTLYNKAVKDSRTDLSKGQRLGRFLTKHGDTAREIYDFNLYRMVTYWTFAYSYYDHPFDEYKGDPDAYSEALAGFHADNNRIHYLNGLLALWLAFVTFTAPAFRRAREGPRWPIAAAVIAAVIFVAHPLQTQAVTYLSQRAESLAGTFYLLGLALYGTARLRSLNAGARGSAPWMTGLVLGGAGVVLVLGAVLASKTDLLAAAGFVKLIVLAALASIGGVLYLVKSGRDEWVHAACTVGAFAAFALGLESKEIVATLPIAICAWELLFVPTAALADPADGGQAPEPQRGPLWLKRALLTGLPQRVRYLGPWAAIVFGVFVLAIVFGGVNIIGQVLVPAEEGGQATGSEVGNATYLFTQFNVFWTYLRLFLMPYGQALDWDYPLVMFGPADGATWLSLIGGALLLGCLGLVAWRGGRARIPSFALLLAVLVLAPTSTVIVLPDVIYEHRWYVPLFGAALVVAALVERGARRFVPEPQQLPAMLGVALALGVGLTALTHTRNQVWASEASLWQDAAAKSPDKPRPWTNLGLTYQNLPSHRITFRANDTEGRPVERTVGGTPVELPDGTTLVMITQDMGTPPISLPPGTLIRVEEFEGGIERAVEAYERALAIDPDYVKALNNLSLIRINQADSARYLAQALGQLAQFYEQRGNAQGVDECARRQTEAIEALRARGQEAVSILDRLVRLEPNNAVYWVNRGNTYATLLDDLEVAYDSVKRSYELPEGPAEGRVTCGTIQAIMGNDAYRAAERAGQDPIAAARPFWETARAHFRDYLVHPGKGLFREQARTELDRMERFLRGEERPSPSANRTGLPDELMPPDQRGGHGPGDGHGH